MVSPSWEEEEGVEEFWKDEGEGDEEEEEEEGRDTLNFRRNLL